MDEMKFTIIVAKVGSESEPWREPYCKETDNPKEWAENIIKRFNETLRPHETARVLLGVEIDNKFVPPAYHDWDKRMTGMSQIFRGRIADIMYCTKCGVTGKRYGLSENIKIDSKFRKKAYRLCDTSQEYQLKNNIDPNR